ncbi:HAD family hydrolase [Streptomyces sp. NPDC001507]|uniref:HAD family hydrolase n=1 Tax=Streptomyces sp. NPDC001507 TaxID=3364579 RepID=UPI0036A4BC08
MTTRHERQEPPVRAVWTDFGGVCTQPVRDSMRVFAERVGVPRDLLQKAIARVTEDAGASDSMELLDTPLITETEWARRVEKVLAGEFGLHADLGDPGEAWFGGRPANSAWVAHLRDIRAHGVFVGLLSNMVPTWERHWRAMVPPDGVFDALVMSYQVGVRKPMREIFDHAAAVAGVPPEACLLVDDLPANCAGAVAAGWRAVEFKDTPEAVAEVAWLTGTGRA